MEWAIVVILVVVAIAVAAFRSRKGGQAETGPPPRG